MSQADLAEAMGTNQPQISRWLESDTAPKKTHHLRRMAQALSRTGRTVSMDYLLDDSIEDIPPDLTPDEHSVLTSFRVLRNLGFSVQEVIESMITMKCDPSKFEGIPAAGGSTGKRRKGSGVIAAQDLTQRGSQVTESTLESRDAESHQEVPPSQGKPVPRRRRN